MKNIFLLVFLYIFNLNGFQKEDLFKTKDDRTCIAKGIFFEAGNQPVEGKIAVAYVILNRMTLKNMNACEVIYEKIGGKNQFLFDHHAKITDSTDKRVIDSFEAYRLALKVDDPTNGAIFFHSVKVKPNWKNYKFTVKIGDHLFYSLK